VRPFDSVVYSDAGTYAVDILVDPLLTEGRYVPPAWDPSDSARTANVVAEVQVFDSLGNTHDVAVYFRFVVTLRIAPPQGRVWEWHALVDGGEVAGGVPGVPVEGASGTLVFTASGELYSETPGASVWDFGGAIPDQPIAFHFGLHDPERAPLLGAGAIEH
jgi:hypothetical protein